MKRPTELSLFLQQRINIWFCVKLNLSLAETKDAIGGVYGNSALSVWRIRFWYREFKNGRTTIVDLHRQHKTRTARNQNKRLVERAVEADRRCTIAQISKDTSLSMATVQRSDL